MLSFIKCLSGIYEGNNLIFLLSFITMMNHINWCPIMEPLLYSWNILCKYILFLKYAVGFLLIFKIFYISHVGLVFFLSWCSGQGYVALGWSHLLWFDRIPLPFFFFFNAESSALPQFSSVWAQKKKNWRPSPPTPTPGDTLPQILHFGTTVGYEDAKSFKKWL